MKNQLEIHVCNTDTGYLVPLLRNVFFPDCCQWKSLDPVIPKISGGVITTTNPTFQF